MIAVEIDVPSTGGSWTTFHASFADAVAFAAERIPDLRLGIPDSEARRMDLEGLLARWAQEVRSALAFGTVEGPLGARIIIDDNARWEGAPR